MSTATYLTQSKVMEKAVTSSEKKVVVSRLTFVEGMRAAAALYVVFGHIANLIDPSFLVGIRSEAPSWMQMILAPFHYGHLAVAAFIVISGFCLRWAAIQRKDPNSSEFGSFIKRRCHRILPPYFACLLISTAVAIFITPIPHAVPYSIYLPVTIPNFTAHLFLVQNFNPAWMYKINGVLWSISIEFQIYFLYRILGLSLDKLGKIFTLLIIGLLVALVILKFDGVKYYPWYVGLFVVGMIAADYSKYRQVRSRLGGLLLWICIAIAAYGIAHRWNLYGTDIPVGIATACALFIGGRRGQKSWIVRFFSWKPLALIGAFSYSLYLIHDPILQSLSIYHPAWVNNSTSMLIYLVLIGIPIAVTASFLFALVFEGKYVRKALKEVWNRKRQKVTV